MTKAQAVPKEVAAQCQSSNHDLLRAALMAAVPLHIYRLRRDRGPHDYDWAKVHELTDLLASEGDNLLYRSTKPGRSAQLFNSLAYAIAVMTFAPGGVRCFGFVWTDDGQVEPEPVHMPTDPFACFKETATEARHGG